MDPYATVPNDKKTNTSITVSDTDRAFLFSVCPHQSILQIALCTLLIEFVRTLKANGVRSYNPDAMKQALKSAKIVVDVKKKEPIV